MGGGDHDCHVGPSHGLSCKRRVSFTDECRSLCARYPLERISKRKLKLIFALATLADPLVDLDLWQAL